MLGLLAAPQPGRPRPGAVPPPRPGLTALELAEREAARRRLEPKWAAFDALVDDFERGDKRLRLRRR